MISPSLTEKHAYGQVYDITDRDTLERVRHWVKELRTVVRNKTLSVQLYAHMPCISALMNINNSQ